MRRSSSICVSPGPPRSADAAALAFQVRPAPHQARGSGTAARQLDLQLALVALRARWRRCRGSARCGRATGTPRWRSRGCAAAPRRSAPGRRSHPGLRAVEHRRLDLVGLAASRRTAPDRAPCAAPWTCADGSSPADCGQQGQFVERSDRSRRTLPDIDTDSARRASGTASGVEGRGGRRTQGVGNRSKGPAAATAAIGASRFPCSAGWKFTARPGTTVEIACL